MNSPRRTSSARPMARRIRPRDAERSSSVSAVALSLGSIAGGLWAAGSRLRSTSRRRMGLVVVLLALGLVAVVGVLNPLPAAGRGGGSSAGSGNSDLSGVGSALASGSGSFNVLDLATKVGLVLVVLFITLRVLGRMQSAAPKRGSRLVVLESRSLASKASLHLVAVGDRRLVVGLTPGGMVSLAEIDAAELDAAELRAAQAEAAEPMTTAVATSRPNSTLDLVMAPIDGFAGRLASLLSGGRAR